MEMLADQFTLADDPRRHFHATYLRTTKAVRAELAAGGFLDAAWVERWCVAFAGYYLDVVTADRRHTHLPAPWALACASDGRPSTLAPLRRVLLGMNAHINYDLPLALVDVISDTDFVDQDLLARRASDHDHIDYVLSTRVDAESGHIAGPRRHTRLAALLSAAQGRATKRFLKEARRKAWANARTLAMARRKSGSSFRAAQRELEDLTVRRAADVIKPGPVLFTLAATGFGVALPRFSTAPVRTSRSTRNLDPVADNCSNP